MNPIRPELRDLLISEAAAVTARRRRRRVALPTAAVATLAAAVLALTTGDSPRPDGPRLLGPQAAVAAASRAVSEKDQVLVWTRESVAEIRSANGTLRREKTTQTRWTDLQTGDTYTVTDANDQRAAGAPYKTETWASQNRLWTATTDATGKRVIQQLPITAQADPSNSTIADVRELLDRARRGDLRLTTERLGQFDATVITRELDSGDTTRLWVSRSEPPRVLKIVSTVTCRKPAGCSLRSATQTTVTTAWKLTPRTQRELDRLRPPNDRPG